MASEVLRVFNRILVIKEAHIWESKRLVLHNTFIQKEHAYTYNMQISSFERHVVANPHLYDIPYDERRAIEIVVQKNPWALVGEQIWTELSGHSSDNFE